jgi:hypothetical protein
MNAHERARAERRSALAACLLPGLVLALGYAFLLRPAIVREQASFQQRVEAARRAAPAPVREAELQRRVDARREALQALREEVAVRVRARAAAHGPDGTEPRPRGLYAEAVARLLAEHRLVLTTEVSGDARAAAAEMRVAAGEEPRTLSLLGRYRDVQAALEKLPAVAPGVELRALSLRPPLPGEELPRWNVVYR